MSIKHTHTHTPFNHPAILVSILLPLTEFPLLYKTKKQQQQSSPHTNHCHSPPSTHRDKMHDKRLLTCIGVMMGLDRMGVDEEEMEDASETTTSSASPKNTPPPRTAQKEEKMDVDKTPAQINVGRLS